VLYQLSYSRNWSVRFEHPEAGGPAEVHVSAAAIFQANPARRRASCGRTMEASGIEPLTS
jgi:hypothetical protein